MRCSNGLYSVKIDSEDGLLFVEQAIMPSVDSKVDLDVGIRDRIIFQKLYVVLWQDELRSVERTLEISFKKAIGQRSLVKECI